MRDTVGSRLKELQLCRMVKSLRLLPVLGNASGQRVDHVDIGKHDPVCFAEWWLRVLELFSQRWTVATTQELAA